MSYSNFLSPAASSEFVALCQSQMALLTQSLGADWSAVYITEGIAQDCAEAKLIPVAVYPQTEAGWQSTQIALIPEVLNQIDTFPRLLSAELSEAEALAIPQKQAQALVQQHQIVLPLIYQEIVMGLLVTRREDRHWQQKELTQIEKVAKTLAIARLLDQRQTWYQQQLKQQQQTRKLERQRLDNLLHQLRNPLTALRTFSKLLLKRFLPEDRNQTVAQSLLRESDHLQELLQQFESEQEPFDMEPTAIVQSTEPAALPPSAEKLNLETLAVKNVLNPILISAEAIASERGINIDANVPATLAPVRADAVALREVLNNLIDNALKYTPAGGRITIRAGIQSPTANWQGIVIQDTGCGIPVSDQEQIFERHYRGVQAHSNIPGSGLGLAIAQELIEAMQGTIELISPNDQSRPSLPGTTFIVWLPIASL